METNKYKIYANLKTRPGLTLIRIRWNQIDWIEVNVIVNRLQRKIYKTAIKMKRDRKSKNTMEPHGKERLERNNKI